MNKITIALAGFLLAPAALFAKGNVTGIALNKKTGSPLDYATVSIINAKTGKPLNLATMTDEAGAFIIKNVPDGDYILKISSVGIQEKQQPFTLSGKGVNLGKVVIEDNPVELKEVVVEGIKSQMRFELDRKVFQVDANVTAAGLSASELLDNIPSVEVDQDGEVSLRGDSSVTIWINGKASGLTADNQAQILEQIPAETIERVEVITNPGSKYSSEGTAGIINIVLKKERTAGYYGSAEIGANTRGGANAGTNINFTIGKWDSFVGLGLRMRHDKSSSESDRTYSDNTFLNSESERRNHGNNIFVRMGTTWHVTDKDDLYFSGFGMFGHRWGRNSTLYRSNVSRQWIADDHFSRNISDSRGTHLELGYTHNWTNQHNFDISVGYSHWGGPDKNNYLQEITYPDGTRTDIYQMQPGNMNMNNVEIKADYSNQVAEWLRVETGFKGNMSHHNSPNIIYQGTSEADMQIVPEYYNRFIYSNNIWALYATLGGKVKNFSFSVGLRGEAWQVRSKSLSYLEEQDGAPVFKKNKFGLFPSIFLSYALPKDNEIQINYTRRTRRPWGGQLNSFHDISDPTNISYGNPELEPQYGNVFELNYIKSWQNHIISFSGYMRHVTGVMNRISYIYDDVMYSTWANVSTRVNAGLELVAKNSFFKNFLNLTTTLNLYNSHMDAWSIDFNHNGIDIPVSGKAQDNFSWSMRMMAAFRLPWGINLQLTGHYRSSQITAQGSRGGGWGMNAGLRKNVGNWSFVINCRDVFESQKFESTIIGQNYVQTSSFKGSGRRFQFTIRYSFGNMNAKQKKSRGNQEGEPMGEEGGFNGGEMGGGVME